MSKVPGLIAIPTTGTVPTLFMQSFCHLMTEFHKVGDPATMWIYYHWTHQARELAAKKCLEEGHEWLFFVDSDMTFPKDTLERLLSHNKPIVSGLCFKREYPPRATLYRALDEDMNSLVNLVRWEPLQRIDASGCACLLIRREVFEQVPPPWFALSEWGNAEDISFFCRVRRAGIEAWADTTVQCGHVGMYEFGIKDYERALQTGELVIRQENEVPQEGKHTYL